MEKPVFPKPPPGQGAPAEYIGAVFRELPSGSRVEVTGHAEYFPLPMMAAFEIAVPVQHAQSTSAMKKRPRVRYSGVAKILQALNNASAADEESTDQKMEAEKESVPETYAPPTHDAAVDPARSVIIAKIPPETVALDVEFFMLWSISDEHRAQFVDIRVALVSDKRQEVSKYAFVEFPDQKLRDEWVRLSRGYGMVHDRTFRRPVVVDRVRQGANGFVPKRLGGGVRDGRARR
ncbi:hypothetical protein J8273_3490 [Carpediemonas membranifera]|uniref:Uncharacterized protein n=1 Tax=Carpediemonas membranifera TaxID=201153 RepID=A0A8J6E9H5_9EUKA|nr:hypothetical protein J8273_3490 [Carpediemonas membranifera]|eukprot:KAG9393355.1 hypothetical protein J8273_3490 [Carpediemonas membranifera]